MNHFSVVTVVRNDLVGLQKSRQSLEEQTYKKWSHIIVDGASNDGTLEYLNTLPKENTIFISEPDAGIYDAMNKAWKLAKPDDFVFYLNARDRFADSRSLAEANVALNVAPSSNWGCTTHEEIQENGEGWVCKLVSTPSIANQLYAYGYRSHQSILMKSSLIEKLNGFDEKYQIAADWDLIVRALLIEKPSEWHHPLARFELGGASSSRMSEAHAELKELRKKFLLRNFGDRLNEYFWCSIYLRALGYKNFLTPIINFIYPLKKLENDESTIIRKHKIITRFIKLRKNSGRFPIVGRILGKISGIIFSLFKALDWFRTKIIMTLNSYLDIQPYRRPGQFFTEDEQTDFD